MSAKGFSSVGLTVPIPTRKRKSAKSQEAVAGMAGADLKGPFSRWDDLANKFVLLNRPMETIGPTES